MYFSAEPPDLLPRIPLSARTILDVGCGNGSLAAAYRPHNPRVRLLGIEIDPAAAATAAGHLNEVAVADVEAGPLPFDLPDGIDCIIYNEVLEYLRDPWTVLRRHAEVLNPDGTMLICVPNVDYWRDTEQRLRGMWIGQSDRGNAAWLGLDDLTQRLREAGLFVCDVATREPDAASARFFAETLSPALSALGIDPEAFARRSAASHLILRVRREPIQPMVVSSTMLDPVGGVSHVRVVHPLRAVGTDPAVTMTETGRVERPALDDVRPRIFVLHRPALFGPGGQKTLDQLTAAGYLIVTEFDDHPDHFDMMRVGGAMTFTNVHALQTSTSALAGVLRQYNPEIGVFPNGVVSLPAVRNFANPAVMTLFFGALNRERDWRPFMPALNAVANQVGDRLRFQVVHDQGFFAALETPHKTFTPTCDYDTYQHILGGCEISFMPLADTAFNRAKSDLKFIEASSFRVATLASTVVYGNSIEDGRTGLLFRDPVEFHTRLLRLLAMPELAMNLGDAARRYVADHRMLAYQVAPRIAWYRSLWVRRESLTEALRVRAVA